MSSKRARAGALIDSDQAIRFHFCEQEYIGYAGDSLASALLASSALPLSASPRLGRPRSLLSDAPDDPSLLVEIDGQQPIQRWHATDLELFPGLRAQLGQLAPQRDWLPAWLSQRLPQRDPTPPAERAPLHHSAEHSYQSCRHYTDVVIIGAGIHGLLATQQLLQQGLRVTLLEHKPAVGGSLLGSELECDEQPYQLWCQQLLERAGGDANFRLLTRCRALRVQGQELLALERQPRSGGYDAKLWRIGYRALVGANGARERPLLFVNNDLPGVMLASGCDAYLRLYGVLMGRQLIFATNNSSVYPAALRARAAGAQVSVVDSRSEIEVELQEQLEAARIKLYAQHHVVEARGRSQLSSVLLCPVGSRVGRKFIKCDALVTSGGWEPDIDLARAAGCAPFWDSAVNAWRVQDSPGYLSLGGAAADYAQLPASCQTSSKRLKQWAQALSAKGGKGGKARARFDLQLSHCSPGAQAAPLLLPSASGADAMLVDYYRDLSCADIRAQLRAELGTCSGLLAALGISATQPGYSLALGNIQLLLNAHLESEATGPPPLPALAPLAFSLSTPDPEPIATSVLSFWQQSVGARPVLSSGWERVLCYPQFTESSSAACLREAASTAEQVGIYDASGSYALLALEGKDADGVVASWGYDPAGANSQLLALTHANGDLAAWCQTSRLGANHYLLLLPAASCASGRALLTALGAANPRICCTDLSLGYCPVSLSGARSGRLLAGLAADPELQLAPNELHSLNLLGAETRCLRLAWAHEHDYLLLLPPMIAAAFWNLALEAGYSNSICAYGWAARRLLELEQGYGFLQLEPEAGRRPEHYGRGSSSGLASSEQRLLHLSLELAGEPGELLLSDQGELAGYLVVTAEASRGLGHLALAWGSGACVDSERLYLLLSDGTKVNARLLGPGFSEPNNDSDDD